MCSVSRAVERASLEERGWTPTLLSRVRNAESTSLSSATADVRGLAVANRHHGPKAMNLRPELVQGDASSWRDPFGRHDGQFLDSLILLNSLELAAGRLPEAVLSDE
jgi:hypothetical protein